MCSCVLFFGFWTCVFLVLGLALFLSSWLLFWWFLIVVVNYDCFCSLYLFAAFQFAFCRREPGNSLETSLLRAIAKSGRQQIGRAIYPFDRLRSISMDVRPKHQPAFPKRIIERARPHTSSTPYNYTQPSAPDFENIKLKRQSSPTAVSTGQLQPAWFFFTGHAEAACLRNY